MLASATELFAERGFAKVTVREICRVAGANVAAITYHFGGKQGLYDEVIRAAIALMRSTTDEIRAAGAGHSAEAQLELYVSIFLARVAAARDGWVHRLMMRELAQPTPALDLVLRQVVRPRIAYLRQVIAAILGCPAGDVRVKRCAMSVQAQCLSLFAHPAAALLPRRLSPRQLRALARHITRFSLAGIRGSGR